MAEKKSVIVRVRRQAGPNERPHWEEFELAWRPHMNVIICLRDIAERPITRDGKAYLRSRRKEIEDRFHAFESAVGPERAALFREFRSTGKLLATNMREVTPKQAEELRKVVAGMREKVLRILSK